MEEQRVSDERLQEIVNGALPNFKEETRMAKELQTSRAALSEAEGLVREMAEAMYGARQTLSGYGDSGVRCAEKLCNCDRCATRRILDSAMSRPSVAAILARGEK